MDKIAEDPSGPLTTRGHLPVRPTCTTVHRTLQRPAGREECGAERRSFLPPIDPPRWTSHHPARAHRREPATRARVDSHPPDAPWQSAPGEVVCGPRVA